jgi:hypothetical protein
MAGWDARVAWLMPAVLSLYAAISASVAKAQKTTARELVGTPMEKEAKRRSRSATWGALVALFMATAAQVAEHVLTTGATGARAWVVIIVSAVPPLVAAHVLHIDPPLELEESKPAVDERETPAQEPQEPAGAPAEELEQEDPTPVAEEPQEPVLVTYSEAADALGLSDVTIRGAANGANPRITKFPGPLVDMRECSTVFAHSRRTVGA